MKSVKRIANEKEKEFARRYGFTQTPASGAGVLKGDMYNEDFMIDVKYTKGRTQATIKKDDCEKMYLDASTYNPGKIPALLVSMDGYNVFCISPDDFMDYVSLKEIENNKDY